MPVKQPPKAKGSRVRTLLPQMYALDQYQCSEVNGEGSDGTSRFTSELMFFPEGKFTHPAYGELDFSAPVLRASARNHERNVVGIDIALDEGHDRGQATGWVKTMRFGKGKVGEQEFSGLWGTVEWTDVGRSFLERKIYKYFSPEWGTFIDPTDGKKTPNVVLGGGLTNRPFFKMMPSVQFEEGKAENVFQMGWMGTEAEPLTFTMPDGEDDDKPHAFDAKWHYPKQKAGSTMDLEELLEQINKQFKTNYDDEESLIAAFTEGRTASLALGKLRSALKEKGFKFKDTTPIADVVVELMEAMTTTNTNLTSRLTKLEQSETNREASDQVQPLIAAGKIVPAQKDHYIKLFKTDPELFKSLTDTMPVVVDFKERGTSSDGRVPGSQADEEIDDEKKIAEEAQGALAAIGFDVVKNGRQN